MSRPALRGVAAALTVGVIARIIGAIALAFRVATSFRRSRTLQYDPAQDCVLGATAKIKVIPIEIKNMEFQIPESVVRTGSAWLELDIRAAFAGGLNEPALRLDAGSFTDTQAVEQGAIGSRHFNVTRLLNSSQPGEKISLSMRGLKLDSDQARLHVSDFRLTPEDRVLIIAPHPDDAEIASFGLYSYADSVVVTITAGQGSDRYGKLGEGDALAAEALIARARVIDSVVIPWLGGVDPERAINLCYPDARLEEMKNNPERDFSEALTNAGGFGNLRLLSRSPLLSSAQHCTWAGLVDDLVTVIDMGRPTIVVTPHPWLDPHADHFYSTVAVCEALERTENEPRAILFTCVHNRRSETWPFGATGDGYIALPAFQSDGELGEDLYSHTLPPQKLKSKFVALEAMHDLREIDWSVIDSADRLQERLLAEVRRMIYGAGGSPTSYFRRALRPDETFFVSSIEFAQSLTGDALQKRNASAVPGSSVS